MKGFKTLIILVIISLPVAVQAEQNRRARILTQVAMTPLYLFSGIFIHESSHAIVAESLGFDVTEFHPYPHISQESGFRFGSTIIDLPQGYDQGRLAAVSIAPQMADIALFMTGDLLLSTSVPSDSFSAPYVFFATLLMPMIDFCRALFDVDGDLAEFSRNSGLNYAGVLAIGYVILGVMTYRVVKHFTRIFV